MKNITVFTVLVIIAYVFATAAPAFGQAWKTPSGDTDSRRFSFAAAPQLGILYGQAEEIVYPFNTRADYLSQLLWNMKPLFYCGAQLDFSLRNPAASWGFFSNLLVKAGIPGSTGKMEDRDWQSIENNALTNYSIHDNETNGVFWIEGMAGIFIPVKSLQFKLAANISYTRFAFTAWNGSVTYAREKNPGQYYDISDSPDENSFTGKAITYVQNWFIVAPAFSVDIPFLNVFSGEVFFQISPLVWCVDMDVHVPRNLEFTEYMRWGLFLEPRGRLTFTANKWLAVSLNAAYRYITGTRGEAYRRTVGEESYASAGEGGAGLSVLDTGLLLKIQF